MTDTIDKLIFALDGDLSGLEGAYAKAEAQSQKTGKAIQANIGKGMDGASASAKKSGAEIEKSIAGTEAATAKAGAAMDALRAKYDPAFASAQKLAQTQKELNQLVTAGALSSAAAAKVMNELGAATSHTHGSVSMATREFRALFDELSSGRTRQSPGTLAIIATRVFGISSATLAWSAALAAIPVGLAVAAAMSEQALARVDEALKRTGNQAGVTRDQILTMSMGIPGLSQTGAMAGIATLVSRGNVAPNLLANVARAAPGYARATGQSDDKAFGELEKLLADPAKGAEQLNEEFKLLDVSTTKQIQHLEESGKAAEAQAILVKALNGRFDSLAESSWSLGKSFDGLWNGVKNFWFNTGSLFTGANQTKQQQVDTLKAYNDTTLKTLAGLGYTDPHAALARNPSLGINQGGAIEPLRNIMAKFDENAGKIAQLQKEISTSTAAATAGRKGLTDNQAVGFGIKIAEGYDEQAAKAKKLHEQLDALNIAIDHATGKNSQYRDQLIRERDAVDTALKNQRTPAQLAEEAAADQRRVAAAPESQRNTLRAQISAQREKERNLSNPATAPFAESIYQSQMGVAALNNRDINKDAAERKRQDEYLAKQQAESKEQTALAAAYDKGAGAVAAMKAAQEAHVAVVANEIRASQQSALAIALQAKAYGAATVAVSAKIAQDREANESLGREAATGGSPSALAKAKIEAEALAATFDQRANARTKEQIDLADKKLNQLRTELTLRDKLNREISSNDQIFNQQRALGNARGQIAAIASGASPDDMRHLQVQQQTIDDLIRRGYEPATDKFKEQLQILLPLNTALSDANDGLQKMRQYSSDLASSITGPLRDFLRNGGNPLDALANMGQGVLDTLVSHEIIDPLQKSLEGLFGSAIGTPKDLLGTSPATPMYVSFGPLGAPGGGGGGGGPLGSLFGGGSGGGGLDGILNAGSSGLLGSDTSGAGLFSFANAGNLNAGLFGGGAAGDLSFAGANALDLFGGGGAAAASGGGIGSFLSSILGFAGLFDDGGTIGPGQWGIKSGMPEIIQGGTHGVSVMPLSAPVVTAALRTQGAAPGARYSDGGDVSNAQVINAHFHLPNVTDTKGFIQSRSQLENAVMRIASRGKRNA